tara:strand:+ start:108 stop:647 length:540 start_codon:yes stop_codon:yes gene_type:complete
VIILSWKKILKRLTFDASQLCCDNYRRDILDFMESYRAAPTFALNRIATISCDEMGFYFGQVIRNGKFTPEQEKEIDRILENNENCYKENDLLYEQMFRKGGDNFKREKSEGLHGWFSRRGGKESKGGKTQGGWIDCGSCGSKDGPKPCGRKDASKGTKRRCRPTCAACKTYKRRKGSP